MRPFSVLRRETKKDNAKLVDQFSAQQIIDAYEKQGQSMWPGMRAIIGYEMQRKDSIIIEGYQISPSFVASVEKEYGKDAIRSVFLVKENEEAILEGWENAPANDWLTKDSSSTTLQKYAALTALYGTQTAAEATKNNQLCVNTDTDFDAQLEKALLALRN